MKGLCSPGGSYPELSPPKNVLLKPSLQFCKALKGQRVERHRSNPLGLRVET